VHSSGNVSTFGREPVRLAAQQHSRSVRTGLASFGAAFGLFLVSGRVHAGDAGGEHMVEVATDQTVKVSGEFRSLQSLIEDLCWRAGVEVYSYDAEDRRVRARYTNVRLIDVLDRLLRNDSYVIGFQPPGPASAEPLVA
jgi:hypothetical protein